MLVCRGSWLFYGMTVQITPDLCGSCFSKNDTQRGIT